MFRQGNHAETLAGLMNLLQVHTGKFHNDESYGYASFVMYFEADHHKWF